MAAVQSGCLPTRGAALKPAPPRPSGITLRSPSNRFNDEGCRQAGNIAIKRLQRKSHSGVLARAAEAGALPPPPPVPTSLMGPECVRFCSLATRWSGFPL